MGNLFVLRSRDHPRIVAAFGVLAGTLAIFHFHLLRSRRVHPDVIVSPKRPWVNKKAPGIRAPDLSAIFGRKLTLGELPLTASAFLTEFLSLYHSGIPGEKTRFLECRTEIGVHL